MTIVGKVESLWRYPVKSMRGEQLQECFIGFPGVYGDRLYGFADSGAHKGFPWLTAREQPRMLLFRPVYRNPGGSIKPGNLADAEALGSGLTPVYADLSDLAVDVETPEGERFAIDDPRLLSILCEGIRDSHNVRLLQSHHAMTDCRPVSIISTQTVHQVGQDTGIDMDKRRFRANLYIELDARDGFGEDKFVGRTLRIGPRAAIAVLNRDTRCKMITLDPDTAEQNPVVMKRLAREHESQAGIYGAVLAEGMVRPGDEITLLD